MYRIKPVFVPHGLPERLLDPSDRGEKGIDQVFNEMQAEKKTGDLLRHNLAAVLKFVVDIENHFSRIISAYLICIDEERQDFLNSALIRTSWCTFSVKSEIALKIIGMSSLYKGYNTQKEKRQQIPDFYSLLTKAGIKQIRQKIKEIGRWRNALAHGIITVDEDNENCYYVNYYSSSQQKQVLDDEFWQRLESLMQDLAAFVVPVRMLLEMDARRTRFKI